MTVRHVLETYLVISYRWNITIQFRKICTKKKTENTPWSKPLIYSKVTSC